MISLPSRPSRGFSEKVGDQPRKPDSFGAFAGTTSVRPGTSRKESRGPRRLRGLPGPLLHGRLGDHNRAPGAGEGYRVDRSPTLFRHGEPGSVRGRGDGRSLAGDPERGALGTPRRRTALLGTSRAPPRTSPTNRTGTATAPCSSSPPTRRTPKPRCRRRSRRTGRTSPRSAPRPPKNSGGRATRRCSPRSCGSPRTSTLSSASWSFAVRKC